MNDKLAQYKQEWLNHVAGRTILNTQNNSFTTDLSEEEEEEEEGLDDQRRDYYTVIIVRPKQVIYWTDFVTRKRIVENVKEDTGYNLVCN
jgi:hypothetical protein